MAGKTVLITGATSGIGEQAALELAGMGAEVVLVGRDLDRLAASVDRIAHAAPGARLGTIQGDLARQADVRRIAREFLDRHPRLDVLLNNAGAAFENRQESPDHIEMTLALNHFAYFLLTDLLLDRLKASAPSRIVSVASEAHRMVRTFDFDDPEWQRRRYRSFIAYGQSKLANILFARALARRLKGTGVTSNSLHPGFVATRFGGHATGFSAYFWEAMQYFAIPIAEGARTSVHLASSPEVAHISGEYFDKCRIKKTTPAALDDAAGERLWTWTEDRIAAIANDRPVLTSRT